MANRDLLTEQYRNNLTEVPNNNPNFLGAKEFMNVPVPIFDLGRILNNRSTKEFNLKTHGKIFKVKILFRT